jgi:hypothetical protein
MASDRGTTGTVREIDVASLRSRLAADGAILELAMEPAA